MGNTLDRLTNLVLKQLEEQTETHKLLARLMVWKLKKMGVSLDKKSAKEIFLKLQDYFKGNLNLKFDNLSIDFENEDLESQLVNIFEHQQPVIKLTKDDFEEFEKTLHRKFKYASLRAMALARKYLLEEWRNQSAELLQKDNENRSNFNQTIHKRWGNALDSLRLLLGICLEMGYTFNHEYRPQASKNKDFVFGALTALHARGCQVGQEILVLLENGFADGGHARWRTLHEIAVTASFISHHGKDVAERYLFHSTIQEYSAMEQYQKYALVLGQKPFAPTEVNRLKNQCDKLITRFGPDFEHDYGWAANVLSKKDLTFAKIEKNAGFEHLRPYFKMSSSNIHAGANAISYRLGLPKERNLLLAGSSIYGLDEPGCSTTYSIGLLTATLILTRPGLGNLAQIRAMQKIIQDVYKAFLEAKQHIT